MRYDWAHTSHLMWIAAEIARDKKKQPTPFKPDDFNPMEQRAKKSKQKTDREPIRGGVAALAAAFVLNGPPRGN